MKTTSNLKGTKKMAVGAAAVLAAVAAGGAYYLYGTKEGRQKREKAAAWVAKARADVAREAKKLRDVALDEKHYKQIVKSVGEKYKEMKKLDTKDVLEFIKNVGAEWKQTGVPMKTAAKKAASKRTVKKVTVKEA